MEIGVVRGSQIHDVRCMLSLRQRNRRSSVLVLTPHEEEIDRRAVT